MSKNETWLKAISHLLMCLFILLIIPLHLFPCFVTGFLVYEIISSFTPKLEKFLGNNHARWIIVIILSSSFIVSIIFCIINLINFIASDIQNNIYITEKINNIFYDIKNYIPNYFPIFLPENIEELKYQIFSLIESNLMVIRNMSSSFFHGLVTIFISLVIGIIVSFNKPSRNRTYFIKQQIKRINYLSQAFRNIVFAQIKISLINTLLTSLMILIILPLFGIHLPLCKTLIILTFIFGLLPIIGNVISNFLIIISALYISISISAIMLVYLILIHKLEYFLNAKIIGNRINAKSWELLLAMLVFESAFGIQGLVAAPIYYGYLKIELRKKGII